MPYEISGRHRRRDIWSKQYQFWLTFGSNDIKLNTADPNSGNCGSRFLWPYLFCHRRFVSRNFQRRFWDLYGLFGCRIYMLVIYAKRCEHGLHGYNSGKYLNAKILANFDLYLSSSIPRNLNFSSS